MRYRIWGSLSHAKRWGITKIILCNSYSCVYPSALNEFDHSFFQPQYRIRSSPGAYYMYTARTRRVKSNAKCAQHNHQKDTHSSCQCSDTMAYTQMGLYLMRLLTIMFPSRNLHHTLQFTVVYLATFRSRAAKSVAHTRTFGLGCELVAPLWNMYFASRRMFTFNFILSCNKNNCYVGDSIPLLRKTGSVRQEFVCGWMWIRNSSVDTCKNRQTKI